MVCATVKGRLEEVEWITVRLDSELTMLDFPSDDDTYERSKFLFFWIASCLFSFWHS